MKPGPHPTNAVSYRSRHYCFSRALTPLCKEKYVSVLLSWNKLRGLTKQRLVTSASVGEPLLGLLKTLAEQHAVQ